MPPERDLPAYRLDAGATLGRVSELRMRLRVLVASPGDTEPERSRLRGVVDELNLGVADRAGIVLELVTWETHSYPSMGQTYRT